jgi:hypothetical protein
MTGPVPPVRPFTLRKVCAKDGVGKPTNFVGTTFLVQDDDEDLRPRVFERPEVGPGIRPQVTCP